MAENKKRKAAKDSEDPERHRLEKASAEATAPLLLPHAASNGVGIITEIDQSHFYALKGLFYLVVAKAKSGVTWGEGESQDPRRRMYGFLPGKRQALIEEGIQIQKYGAVDSQEHEDALKLASVDLASSSDCAGAPFNPSMLYLDESVVKALKAITQKVHCLVPEKYKEYATMEQLVAVQPNLHNGASYLPAHLDFPRNDGFGVIIVTVGIRGCGTVVLIDDGDEEEDAKSFSFTIAEGEAYVLCGDARNKCVHGVLCAGESSQRETLNLRYGLHSAQLAYDEVDRHWPD